LQPFPDLDSRESHVSILALLTALKSLFLSYKTSKNIHR